MLDVLLGPWRTSQIAFARSSGFGDLMTIAQLLLQQLTSSPIFSLQVPNLLAVAGAGAAAIWMERSKVNEPVRTALGMVFTLLLF